MTLPLGEAELRFLADHPRAAMITLRADGTPHAAQVGIGLVEAADGTQRLWSSGTPGRVRTRHLRRDPRCTLFVFDPPLRWLGLETTVTILGGPDVPELHPRLFRAVLGLGPEEMIAWGNRQASDEEIVAMAAAEQRLIYDFEIHRTYGRLTA
jgi:PPOX class probable F420-dependent enzyme